MFMKPPRAVGILIDIREKKSGFQLAADLFLQGMGKLYAVPGCFQLPHLFRIFRRIKGQTVLKILFLLIQDIIDSVVKSAQQYAAGLKYPEALPENGPDLLHIAVGNRMKNQVKKIHANQAYQLYYHGMMLPGFIFLILFNFVPMFGVIMAFQDYKPAKGFFGSDFVGLKHFKYLFEMPDSFELFRNTLIIALGKIVFTTIMSIAFAILLNEVKNRTLKKSVQTVVYLPHFLSWVVLALVIKNLFSLDGSINAMLGTSLNWLGSNSLFQPLLILTDTWKEFGYGSIVYLAAITSIDSTLYEAASIDGATWWKKVWHVTLPGIRTTIVLMAVMNLGNILNAGFDQVYNLYSASVYATGDILDTYVYRVGLQGLQYSFGTAVGLLKSVIAFVLMIGANKLAQKYTDSKIF